MRQLVGFGLTVLLVASPLGVRAEAQADGAKLEPTADKAAAPSQPVREEPPSPSESPREGPEPSSGSASERPATRLELDNTGVEVSPSLARTSEGFTLKEMDGRVRRAGIGLGVSILALGASFGMIAAGLGASICISFGEPCSTPRWTGPVTGVGMLLAIGGISGTIACAILLARRKRDRDSLREAQYARPRRARWDLAQSRLMF